MQQLDAQDASFLYLETANAPMHLGAVTIYDQRTVPGGVQGFKNLLAAIERRLHLARTFRRRVQRVPLNLDHPWWIEDADFDLEFHVRHIALPRPGDWRQLCIQAARLHARPLDPARPLWELTIIEGLDDIDGLPPGCYAVVSKLHQAAVRGIAGDDIGEALHDLVPRGAPVTPSTVPWRGETPPSTLGLLGRSWWNGLRSPLRGASVLARSVPALARLTEGFLDASLRRVGPVPRTRFDGSLGPHRVVDGRVMDLDEIAEVRRAVKGATVNDVVLAIVGGALRRYLGAHGDLPERSLVALAPVSVRETSRDGRADEAVAPMNVSLGTHLPDALQRLHYVAGSTRRSKALTKAVGARLMTDYTRFIPSAVAGLAARLYSRLALANRHHPLFNCVVTNVPGPQVPLYAGGARLVTQLGLGPLFDGMGLAFPVSSYAGHLSIAFTADRDVVTDPERLADALDASFEELRVAAGAAPRERSAGEALRRAAERVAALATHLGHDDLLAAPDDVDAQARALASSRAATASAGSVPGLPDDGFPDDEVPDDRVPETQADASAATAAGAGGPPSTSSHAVDGARRSSRRADGARRMPLRPRRPRRPRRVRRSAVQGPARRSSGSARPRTASPTPKPSRHPREIR